MMANSNVNFVRRLTLPNYRVVFHEEIEREYVVRDCRTAEEAEGIAENLRNDDLEHIAHSNTSGTIIAVEAEEIEEEV